ncbi:hypothetical protein DJ84_08015 [Halorubrum ezzemoulense]|nr:hypothetical protein DJ84_08015 [Halorubrum ezzemoulense]
MSEINTKSKISLFIGDLSIGGAERVAVNLANQLAVNGHQVEIVLVERQGELVSAVSDNVNIFELDTKRMRWAVIPLTRYLRESKPEVVIPLLTPANVIMILAAKISRTAPQVIVTEHGQKMESSSLSMKRDTILAKYLYKYADNIVGVSNGVSENVRSWANIDPDSVTTIYNPVIDEEMISRKPPAPPHPWFQQNDIKVILTAGRHVKQKDHSTLIRSFTRLLKDRKDVRLVLLGEGELTPEYEQLAKELGSHEKILLPGFVEDPFQYMSHADVFVLSSRWEGLSLVLIEAMASGTQVVSTDCPSGPSEVLMNGEYGNLVPVGDPEAMKNALIDIFENPFPEERLRDRARDFSIEKSTNQYENLFNLD